MQNGRDHKYGFGGKEEQDDNVGGNQLNWLDFGARNYDAALGRWFVVDALADEPEQIDKSPFAYGWNNPIFYSDPDGNCPWCAVIAGAWEYGSQVYDNYQTGDTGYNAWVGNVDFVDVAIEAGTNLIPGGKLLKGTVMVGGEFIKNSVDVTGNLDVNYINDGTEKMNVENVLKGTAIDATVGLAVGKVNVGKILKNSTDNKAVSNAASDKVAAYKNLHKANNVIANGNTRSKALLPNEAFKNVNNADVSLQIKKTLNSLGTATDASKTLVNKTVEGTTKEIIK